MPIIITLCSLLLVAYIFDLTSSKTKIPSVILLLLLGWIVKELAISFDINFPDFQAVLPILGTLGLILIVLEGSLELELNRSKIVLIKKSFLGALIPMLVFSFLMAYLFQQYAQVSFRSSLINAVPFAVISSAIALPSVRNFSSENKEFIIYESSLSDILGVLFFNFIAINNVFGVRSFSLFWLQLIIILAVSFIATLGLSYLLSKIEHHIKFVPIIILTILIYAISKIYHLPGLIFILIFGLTIGNLDELKESRWIKKLHTESLDMEVQKFKELTIEITFLVRSLFFLLFGFLLQTKEILDSSTLLWAVLIVALIFAFRALQLWLSRLPLRPLLFIAPRGLITILLFLSIDPGQYIEPVNKSLIVQVIILTALVMMFGTFSNEANKKTIKERTAGN